VLLGAGAPSHTAGRAQVPSAAQPDPYSGQGVDSLGMSKADMARMKEAREKQFREDRHKRLQEDSDRLLALATDLKAEVDKSNKDELSVTVIAKAAEIERLAHDVKERMKN